MGYAEGAWGGTSKSLEKSADEAFSKVSDFAVKFIVSESTKRNNKMKSCYKRGQIKETGKYLDHRGMPQEIRDIAEKKPVYSIPGLTFMSALSDADGNVLHIVPGQGSIYYEKPEYKILTNFSPYKQNSETHPWMGWDRYHIAKDMLKKSSDDFDVDDCFDVLKEVSQEVCPTVVSMVYDVTDRTVYWCENRDWDKRELWRWK